MKITHKTISLFLALVFVGCGFQIALAQSPSPSGSAELREIIRQRIEQTMDEKNNPKSEFIGTLGTITKVGTSTFSLMDTTGRERTIDISPTTTILSKNAPVKLSDLTINSGAVVMGTAVDEVILAARRVLVQEDNFAENRTVLLGTVEAIEKNTVLKLRERDSRELSILEMRTTTKYEDIVGTPVEKKLLEADQSVLVILDIDANKKQYVRRVRLLVPVAVGSTTEKPKVSPSPTPKPVVR
jgi:hypothetical protein